MNIIISGGGTGGHIFPAIAVAQALKKLQPDARILFAGAKGKMEMEKVPEAGFDIEGLWISGLQRKMTMKNMLFPVKLMTSLAKSFSIINRFKPDVVAAFGGFASGPVAQVAAWKGIPVILQEQNSYPGITNKLLAKKAKKICVAYPGMEKFFPAEKIIFTGNPVREDISQAGKDINSSLRHFDLVLNKKTVLVFGGSLGAGSLNEALRLNLKNILEANPDVQFIWQAGKLYYDKYRKLDIVNDPRVKLLPFINRMDLAYAVADVVVSRAGALTISELSLAGRAAILVPSPNVAEDHQTKNAMSLVRENAAIMVKDDEVIKKLPEQLNSLLKDEEKRKTLQNNIKKLAKPNAARDIAKIIIENAKTK